MGLLLKLILFGVALYAVWTTLARWKGLLDRATGKPLERERQPARPAPASPQAPLGPRKVVIEDTVQCAACGAYQSSAAEKCGHCGRPLRA